MPKGFRGFQKGNAPPNTGRTHFKKGQISWSKGKKLAPLSEETRKKMSESRKGKKRPPMTMEWKNNISKGKKNPSIETRKKLSEARKGEKHTAEWKQKMSQRMLGNKHSLGNKMSEIAKEKIRQFQVNNPNKIFKDTSIELKVEAELKKRGINYQKQVSLCNIAIVDFYLPEYRIIIQCDGDYWHNKVGVKEKDEKKDKVLVFNGFNVYRFWQHEIDNSVSDCINKIFFRN